MKKRFIGLLTAAAILLGILAGCGEKETVTGSDDTGFAFGQDSVASSETESQDVIPTIIGQKTFSMPYNSSYGWDPYSCMGMENRAVMQLIYEGLFTLNHEFDAEPVLCKSYTLSDDGLTYTFELQEATFSNGKELTAEDVLYSLGKAAETGLYVSRFRDVGYFEVTGLRTLVIHMNSPNDRLPALLDCPIIPSQSSTASPVGTGPFVHVSSTALKKNDDWWQGADKVSFDTVKLYSSVSAEDTRDNFEIDNVHFVYNNPLSTSTAADFHCDYELYASKDTVMQYIGFNMQYGVFQDQNVRQAALLAIDRAGIAEKVYHNYADAAALPVAPSSSMYDEDLARQIEYNPDAALQGLLDSSSFYLPEDHPLRTGQASTGGSVTTTTGTGVPDEEASDEYDEFDEQESEPEEENEMEYNRILMLVASGNLNRVSAAKMAAEQLAAVGFTVELAVVEEDEFFYRINNTEYDLFYSDVALTPDFELRSLLLTNGDLNYGHIGYDETLESLLYASRENSGNRYDLYEYLIKTAYICPVLFQNNAVFTTRGVLTGLDPSPGNLFYNIENIEVN